MTPGTARGQVVRTADGVRLEYVRTCAAPPARVWTALTDPDVLARWFGRWTGDPASGRVELAMTAEGDVPPETVVIEACDAPRRLAVTVPGPEGSWPLAVTLDEQGTGTRLRLVHELDPPYDARSIGPGWQYYLDRLDAVLAGAEPADDWESCGYPGLAGAYAVPDAPAT